MAEPIKEVRVRFHGWSGLVLDLAGTLLFLALGLWALDQIGIEKWTAGQIGKFIRLVIEASGGG